MSRSSEGSFLWIPALAATTALSVVTYSLLNPPRKYHLLKEFALVASLKNGFCGFNNILISRLPLNPNAAKSWEVLLGLFHEPDACVRVIGDRLVSQESSWSHLSASQFERDAATGSLSISRTTLITFLVISNARIIYQYSDSSGYRAALGSWTGQWYIDMRAGGPATVTLRPHDSHSPAADVYPPIFPARVDRCIQMMAGVVVREVLTVLEPAPFSVAFPGRLDPGRYKLEYQPKGFGLSHGSRHIYNMNGGKVFEIDFLYTRAMSEDEQPPEHALVLKLPSLRQDHHVSLYAPGFEQYKLAEALDCLPWSNLSWSIHRGMRDLLLAFAQDTMDKYRPILAKQLRAAAVAFRAKLLAAGWEENFTKDYMGDMASSAVLAGRGNSGDAVRIVTALAEQIHGKNSIYDVKDLPRDVTYFWRDKVAFPSSTKPLTEDLSVEAIIALTKVFVLEWSVDFDYQMYHQLPLTLLFT